MPWFPPVTITTHPSIRKVQEETMAEEEQIMNETAETIVKEEDETQIFKKQIWLGYVDTQVLGRYYGMLTL